jgi:hypothetical protein
MKKNNYLVDLYTVLCYTASSVVRAWGFVYDLSAVISAMSHFSQLTVSSVVRHSSL